MHKNPYVPSDQNGGGVNLHPLGYTTEIIFTLFQYSFQREKEAILEYEKEREKPKMKPPDLTSAKSLESTRNESTFSEKLPRPSMVPQEILQPSRINFPTSSKMEVLQPSTSISGEKFFKLKMK